MRLRENVFSHLAVNSFVAVSRRRGHIERGVLVEEPHRDEREAGVLDGHDGPILGPWQMRHAEGVPEHDVLVGKITVRSGPHREPAASGIRAQYSAGDWQGAIDACRAGLQIDPLAARLYFNLGLMLEQHGDAEGSKRARALAAAIDPGIVSRPSESAP